MNRRQPLKFFNGCLQPTGNLLFSLWLIHTAWHGEWERDWEWEWERDNWLTIYYAVLFTL